MSLDQKCENPGADPGFEKGGGAISGSGESFWAYLGQFGGLFKEFGVRPPPSGSAPGIFYILGCCGNVASVPKAPFSSYSCRPISYIIPNMQAGVGSLHIPWSHNMTIESKPHRPNNK